MSQSRTPDADSVRAERARRQHLDRPLARKAGYEGLFRALQPATTGAYARPGSPPHLAHRTRFDGDAVAAGLRRERRIVKGRFQGGGVAYVLADDLELYANAFCRPLLRWSDVQKTVYESVCTAGPLTASVVKEDTGLLKKQIMPALHRLQEAFLVYEDQVDDDWERGWYELGSEWPGVRVEPERADEAAAEVLARFFHAHVFATEEQVCDWSRFKPRRVRPLLGGLAASGKIVAAHIDGLGEGWLHSDATGLAAQSPDHPPRMLPQKDYLSRSHETQLRRRYAGVEVLQYLFVRGAFCGAVVGHWGFKPYDVEDVVVELPARERAALRDEILALVGAHYHEPNNKILRYAGRSL